LLSYAGGRVPTGRVSHAGQVKSEIPDRETPWSSRFRLGIGLTPQSHKKQFVKKTIQLSSQPDSCLGIRLGHRTRKKKMDNQTATWNIRTMLQPGKMNELGLEILKINTEQGKEEDHAKHGRTRLNRT
jgi:hypothetical protein